MVNFGSTKINETPIQGSFEISPPSELNRGVANLVSFLKEKQTQSDNLGLMKATNNIFSFSNKFLNDLEKSGDYINSVNRLKNDWDEFSTTISSTGMSNSGRLNLDMLLKTSFEKLKARVSNVSNELEKQDYDASVNVTLENLKDNAYNYLIDLEESKSAGDELIENKFYLTPSQKELEKQKWNRDLFLTNANYMIKTDPGTFLKEGVEFFKKHLSKDDISSLTKSAQNNLLYEQNLAKKLNQDKIASLSALADNHYSSLENTGIGVNQNIAAQLESLGANSEAKDFKYKEKIALQVFEIKSQLEKGTNFTEKFTALNSKKPKGGDPLYKYKKEVFNKASAQLLKEQKEFFNDPVAYVNKSVDELVETTGINKYEARSMLLMKEGVANVLFTNQEKQMFVKQFKNLKGSQQAELVDLYLNSVPSNLQSIALYDLPLDDNFKFIYSVLNEDPARRDIVLNYLYALNVKEVPSYIKKNVDLELAQTIGSEDVEYEPLNYYKARSMLTGDRTDAFVVSNAGSLIQRLAYSLSMQGNENPVPGAVDLLFGEYSPSSEISKYIMTDRVIGRSVMNIEDDTLVEYLEDKIDNLNIDDFGYPKPYMKMVKNQNGSFIEYPDGYYLFDKTTRQPLLLKNGELFKIGFDEINYALVK